MSDKSRDDTDRLLVQTQRIDGGLTQEEVDELSLKTEGLLRRGEDPREIVEWVLTELPDSEYGYGEYSLRTESDRSEGDDE